MIDSVISRVLQCHNSPLVIAAENLLEAACQHSENQGYGKCDWTDVQAHAQVIVGEIFALTGVTLKLYLEENEEEQNVYFYRERSI